MPRKARIDGPGVVHHIIVRRIERRSIFKDDHDRERFTMDATAAMHHAIVRGIERRYRVRFVEFSCLNLLPISYKTQIGIEKRTEEWLRQADYDIDTAEYMHQGRYLHAVFMCHLAVENMSKGTSGVVMPRKARIDAPGAVHHIIVRGIERRSIFRDDLDRNRFLEKLGVTLKDSGTP